MRRWHRLYTSLLWMLLWSLALVAMVRPTFAAQPAFAAEFDLTPFKDGHIDTNGGGVSPYVVVVANEYCAIHGATSEIAPDQCLELAWLRINDAYLAEHIKMQDLTPDQRPVHEQLGVAAPAAGQLSQAALRIAVAGLVIDWSNWQ